MSTPIVVGGDELYPWLSDHWSFFLRRLAQDRLAHAILVIGPSDCGQKVLAEAMVARLLCSENEPTACGQCRSCKLLAGGAHPDYFELQPEEDSKVVKVDQVRDLIAKLDLTTSVSKRKVAFIHPADSMNASAANALLKSLEEPSGDTVLILVSSNPGNLPVTIRSRCQAITVSQPDKQVVLNWLTQTSGKPQDSVVAALQAAGGSPLRAAQYLDSPELDAYRQVREALATLLARPASASVVGSQLGEIDPVNLWRWISMCTGEIIKSLMTGETLDWFPSNPALQEKTLLELQRQADINRRMSSTPVRGDLLLLDWLIRWAEQVV